MGILIGLVTKVMGWLGPGFLQGVLNHYKSKDVQNTSRFVHSLEAELAFQQEAMKYRLKLLDSNRGAFLVFLIVVPPALYIALIYIDTIQGSITGSFWGIERVPERYAELAESILLTFIGVGGVAVGAAKAVRELRK